MSDNYVTPEQCDEYVEWWEKRFARPHADIQFSTTAPNVIERLHRSLQNGEKIRVNLQGWRGAAYVIKLETKEDAAGAGWRCDATLRPTGRPTLRSDALSAWALGAINADEYTNVNVKTPDKFKEKHVLKKVVNRFYVAASNVTTLAEQGQVNEGHSTQKPFGDRRWTKAKLEDAVAHATEVLDAEPGRDHVAIVRIVVVVRRKKTPVVVEKVA